MSVTVPTCSIELGSKNKLFWVSDSSLSAKPDWGWQTLWQPFQFVFSLAALKLQSSVDSRCIPSSWCVFKRKRWNMGLALVMLLANRSRLLWKLPCCTEHFSLSLSVLILHVSDSRAAGYRPDTTTQSQPCYCLYLIIIIVVIWCYTKITELI